VAPVPLDVADVALDVAGAVLKNLGN